MNLIQPYRGLPRPVYTVFIAQTINAFGALIHPFLTLLLSRKIGLNPANTGMIVSLLGILYAPASLIGGKLSDTFGRKPVLIIGDAVGAISYGVCVFIEPSIFMVGLLGLASVSFGIAGPSHSALIADYCDEQQRQGAYSLLYLGFNLGFAFAQMLAGSLFENHLQLMFGIDVITAVMALILIALFVKEPNRDAESDGAPQSIKPNFDKRPEVIQAQPRQYLPEQKNPAISTISVLCSRPVLLLFALIAFGYKFIYAQWGFLVPLHAEALFADDGAALFGVLGSLNAFTVVLFTPVLTAMFAKLRNIQRMVLAGMLFTIGFGMLGIISFKGAFFISVFVFTIGEIFEAISTTPFIMNHSPATHRGRIGALVPIIMGTGYALGPWIMGGVAQSRGFSFAWLIIGGIGVVSTLAMAGISRFDTR